MSSTGKPVGKKGVWFLRRLMFHYTLQNFIANIMTLAAIIIIGFGAYNAAQTAYKIYTCTEKTEGYVEKMEDTSNPLLQMVEEKYPSIKKKYPVIRYDTKNGKYIHQSSSSVKVTDNTQFSAEVRYDPHHGDSAILSIEIFDQIGRSGVLLLLGIIVLINSRMLHMPNLKSVKVPEGADIAKIV